jgi:uroporphyrin-III C-methyltransferase
VIGRVYLVGAGPGDPRLLTLRGAEVLRRADVVVYDRLVSPSLLELPPVRAERIFAGKKPGGPHRPQGEINRMLVEHAKRGRAVVRLKGGDAFVFGRGGEEALACARAGVPFEIVPGVTSAVAAPAAAGIPLTHRGLARSFGVTTASTADGSEPDWNALARGVDTLVVLMAVAKLDEVCRGLISSGRPADEPAAVVQWATTDRQRRVLGSLAALPRLARDAGIGPPATLIVGRVVALAGVLAGVEGASVPAPTVRPTGTAGAPLPTRRVVTLEREASGGGSGPAGG